MDMPAAGKPTASLNNSANARFVPAQSHAVILESYTRPARREASGLKYGVGESQPAMWQAMQYDTSQQWKPEQGLHTTRFGRGFARRHISAINPYNERLQHEAARVERQAGMTEFRRAHLEQKLTFKGSGYNILTGEETGGWSRPMHSAERRHISDCDRSTGRGSDTPAYRLKDSTSRFYADSQQMPPRPHRTANLVREGLTTTHVRAPPSVCFVDFTTLPDRVCGRGMQVARVRCGCAPHRECLPLHAHSRAMFRRAPCALQRTSTIIGVGKTIRHEIPSVGTGEAFLAHY